MIFDLQTWNARIRVCLNVNFFFSPIFWLHKMLRICQRHLAGMHIVCICIYIHIRIFRVLLRKAKIVGKWVVLNSAKVFLDFISMAGIFFIFIENELTIGGFLVNSRVNALNFVLNVQWFVFKNFVLWNDFSKIVKKKRFQV